MTDTSSYDLIVIGAGQGGGPLAGTAAEKGRSAALIEHAHVGGTCVNVGCTPTKTMIASAQVAQMPMSHVARGLEVDESRGLMKAIVDSNTKKLLGATVLAIECGEVMSVLQTAMMGDLPLTRLKEARYATRRSPKLSTTSLRMSARRVGGGEGLLVTSLAQSGPIGPMFFTPSSTYCYASTDPLLRRTRTDSQSLRSPFRGRQ